MPVKQIHKHIVYILGSIIYIREFLKYTAQEKKIGICGNIQHHEHFNFIVFCITQWCVIQDNVHFLPLFVQPLDLSPVCQSVCDGEAWLTCHLLFPRQLFRKLNYISMSDRSSDFNTVEIVLSVNIGRCRQAQIVFFWGGHCKYFSKPLKFCIAGVLQPAMMSPVLQGFGGSLTSNSGRKAGHQWVELGWIYIGESVS